MNSKRFSLRRALLFFCVVLSASAEEPPENLDFVGGYFEDGVYKCYQEPCFKIHKHSYPAANNIQFNPKMWPRWLDVDRNCQKENVQMIAESSLSGLAFEEDNECSKIISGRWIDAYTGKEMQEVEQVVTDYYVSLKEAHSFGGLAWPRNKRALFSNTSHNLMVVSKEQRDARDGRSGSEWMPPEKSFWCEYVVKRETIARQFELPFPSHEKAFHQSIKNLYCKY